LHSQEYAEVVQVRVAQTLGFAGCLRINVLPRGENEAAGGRRPHHRDKLQQCPVIIAGVQGRAVAHECDTQEVVEIKDLALAMPKKGLPLLDVPLDEDGSIALLQVLIEKKVCEGGLPDARRT